MRRSTATTTSIISVLVGGALLLPPAAIAADTGLGSVFVPGPNNCAGNSVFQAGTAEGSYRVPTAGVITSWRFQPGAVTGTAVALKLGRFPTPTTGQVVGTSDTVAVAGPGLVQGKTRLPAQVGDVLGLWSDGHCATATSATDSYAFATGNAPAGTAISGAMSGYRIDIAATLEPDADGDGFGDTSQDLCPSRATTQAECVAPTTRIDSAKVKRPGSKPGKAKVTVKFSVSEPATSTCAVDRRAAKPCTSPFRFKATVGKHRVTVTSTDTAGNVGVAVTRKVKVTRR